MRTLSLAISSGLATYIVSDVIRFVPQYRQLKQAIANGDASARTRLYYRALVFEWVSALLAILSLGFHWDSLNPKLLALESTRLIRPFSPGAFNRDVITGMVIGVVVGMTIGLVGLVVARLRANRRGVAPADAPVAWWRKLLPDFSALVPVTPRERLVWAAVAISAGVCEETVFRGWLLATLHGTVGLAGTALILVAAAIFGLVHAYQGITGVILTAFVGAFFCVLYVATDSLLVPILLHSLADLRFAFLPAPRTPKPQPAFA